MITKAATTSTLASTSAPAEMILKAADADRLG